MSISFNHPKNTVTSTGSLNLTVTGGNITTPQPIRFNSTSVVMPVRELPSGEAGAMVFDTVTKTMKYHDGLSWVELLGQDTILEPIYVEINRINASLGTKVDNVVYNVGAVPQASISGTQLNITFPPSSSTGSAANGLFTGTKQGTIVSYALTSGMSAATIREQMSGASNGQAGRNGTQSAPWITNDGYAFADGMWWTWQGTDGVITQIVPNLNQEAYLKPMAVSGTTQITNKIISSATIAGTALTIAQLPSHQFTVSGTTSSAGSHNHSFANIYNTRISIDDVRVQVFRDGYGGGGSTNYAGDHIHTFSGTSNVIGSNQTHTHSINNLDVDHFTVAVLYNIATPSYALNEKNGDARYVLKAGDTMTGSLTIATSAVVRSDDTNVTFSFRANNNTERAMIYHNNTNNTLRMRSFGGSEVTISTNGTLSAVHSSLSQTLTVGTTSTLRGAVTMQNTASVSSSLTVGGAVIMNNTASVSGTLTVGGNTTVGGKNVVRSVNGTNADASGNVALAMPTGFVQDIKLGPAIYQDRGGQSPAGYVVTWVDGGETMSFTYAKPIQKQVNGVWSIITG